MDRRCSVYRTENFIGKRWTLLILLELYKAGGSRRYVELKKSLLNITPKILSLRLKELEKEGLIKKRVDHKTVPIKSTYTLTDSGRDFINVIKEIRKWTIKWKSRTRNCLDMECRHCNF